MRIVILNESANEGSLRSSKSGVYPDPVGATSAS
jgi:hypothetical protein